jgi:hypothetical protein
MELQNYRNRFKSNAYILSNGMKLTHWVSG